MSRTTRLLAALLLGWLLAGVALAGPAAAHASLVATTPGEGARLPGPPDEISLRFSESVSIGAGFVRVLDGSGRPLPTGEASVDGGTVTVPFDAPDADAGYLVTFRVVSADSHPVAGAFSFAVGDADLVAAGVAAQDAPGGGAVGVLLTSSRWLGYAGLALAVGVPVFLAVCRSGGWADLRFRRLAVVGAGAMAVGALVGVLLQGPYVASTGLGGVADPGLLAATAESPAGQASVARLLLTGAFLAVLLPPWRRGDPPSRSRLAIGAALAVGLALSVAGVGHAVAGPYAALALVNAAAHALAMAVWLGGLACLVAGLLRSPSPDLAAVLPRFSALAFGAVTVLVLTGVVQSLREVGSPAALVSTSYGQVLLAKLVLVALILGAAAVSRIWVQQRLGVRRRRPATRVTVHAFASGPPVPASDRAASDRAVTDRAVTAREQALATEADEHLPLLRRSVLLELTLAVVVLALSAVLTGTPPARASLAAPVDVTLPLQGSAGAEGSVQLTVDPARPGPTSLHLYLYDDGGRLIRPADLRVTLTEEQQELGPLEVELAPAGPGHYASAALSFPSAGTWTLTATVRLDEFTARSATTRFPVR